MNKCDICLRKSADVYRLDDHYVCESCLMAGRLSEMPDFAAIEQHEMAPLNAASMSSWWNREIPSRLAH